MCIIRKIIIYGLRHYYTCRNIHTVCSVDRFLYQVRSVYEGVCGIIHFRKVNKILYQKPYAVE